MKFMSKYEKHIICYRPAPINGIKQDSKKLKFIDGYFETTDKEEAHAIRKSSPFGVSIVELKTVDLKPEFKKDKEEKEDKI